MFYIKKIKKFLANNDIRGAKHYMRERQGIRESFVGFVVIAIIGVLYIHLPFYFIDRSDFTTEDYQIKESTKLVFDEELTMDTQEKADLIESTRATFGQYYSVFFVNVDCEDVESLLAEVNNTLNGKLYDRSVAILHNEKDDKFYFWPNKTFANNTRIFELVEYNDEMTEKLLVKGSEAYADMLSGTPAQVYDKVFAHILEKGYADNGAEYAEARTKEDYGFTIVMCYLGVVFGAAIVVPLAFGIADGVTDWVENFEYGFIDEFIYLHLEKKHKEKQKKLEELKKKQAEENEKKKTEEERRRELEENKNHPALMVIERLDIIRCVDNTYLEKKNILIEKLKIVDNIMSISSEVDKNIASYFDSFIQGIEDIAIYAKTHNTDFDTPEELKVICDAMDLFIEITSAFTKKYEDRDASNIGVSLDVLRKKAVFDGLVSKDFDLDK